MAKRDENRIPTLQGVLNTDGETVVNIQASDTIDGALMVENNTTGSDNGPTNAKRDGNYVTTIMAVSSVDGVTPVALYANSNGELLIDSS